MEQVHRAIHEAVLEAGPKQLAYLMGNQRCSPHAERIRWNAVSRTTTAVSSDLQSGQVYRINAKGTLTVAVGSLMQLDIIGGRRFRACT